MKLRKTAALLLIFILLLSGCGAEKSSRDFLSIWCLESEPLRLPLEKLIEEYNSSLPQGLLPAQLRSFPDEESLSAGFDTLRPDILICSDLRAEALFAQGLSRDMSSILWDSMPEYPEYIKDRLPSVPAHYLPVGGDIQLIYGRQQAMEGITGLSSLLSRAAEYGNEKRLPFLCCDSYSELFYQCLLSSGKEFHAVELRDIKNPAYIESWNLISDAAFSHALISPESSGRELIDSRYLPCAIIRSSSLAGQDLKDMSFLPLEGLGECENLLSSLSGLVLTVRDGRSTASAEGFLLWLASDKRISSLALSSGLVPLSGGAAEADAGPLERLLTELASSRRLHLPEGGSDWILNREKFEAGFRENIALLG